ncbi:phasin family protein [Alkalilimnicola sp. S0819]|uniref:phasin family protein n=1 Tax=Alkalilimnicola sp. S0819 TaxID=2613922 RepID=UPI001262A5CD|nr:phasin family protein [Alkalilimnicola sp. S0819]KAB7623723.1 hypothetical protein F3N43_09415 [Alkalilimnicola sp. S0819]MPQ16852.1 hypothetical protein [Alkalilimnicola sp. S0819]
MHEERLKQMNAQLDRISAPMHRMTALMINSAERMTDFQLKAAQKYSHLAFVQWRDALEVRDPQSLQGYLEKQNRYANEYSRCLSEDAEALADIGQDFSSQVQRVMQQNMDSMTEAARRANIQMNEQMEKAEKTAEKTAEKAADKSEGSSGRRRSA